MNGLIAVKRLAAMGYHFQIEGDALRYKWKGLGKPDPSQVCPLFEMVKAHKPEVLAYLNKPVPPERVLTCYECGHFRPAVNSPNPTEAWGHCRKQDKGRYGVATACKAILNAPDAPGEAINN